MPTARSAGATGLLVELIPADSPERDELLQLVRMAVVFKNQHQGKRRGFLAHTIEAAARRAGPPYSFEALLVEFENAAIRRANIGPGESPVEKVDRIWQLLTYHDPRKGRIQATFKHARNLLTACKKILQP